MEVVDSFNPKHFKSKLDPWESRLMSDYDSHVQALTDCLVCPGETSCVSYTEVNVFGKKFQLKSCLPADAIPSELTNENDEIEHQKRFLDVSKYQPCS